MEVLENDGEFSMNITYNDEPKVEKTGRKFKKTKQKDEMIP